MRGNPKNILKKILSAGLTTKVRSFFKQEYFQSHIINWLLTLSILSNLSIWASLIIFVKPVDFPIILHYNVYFGVDNLGDWKQVYIMPAVGLALLLINFFLSLYFYRNKERIATYLLLLAALMVQLSLLIAAVSVIVINY